MDLEADLGQVRLKVKAPFEVNIGDPLILDIELENPSTRDVAFTPGQGLQAFYVDVIRTNHVRAKRTALGNDVFEPDEGRVNIGGNGVVSAKKSRRFTQDISKLFELSPGSYGVLVSVGIWTIVDGREEFVGKAVWSNVAEIRLKATDAPNAAATSK